GSKRIDGVGRALPLELGPLEGESRRPLDGQREHGRPVFRRGAMLSSLKGLLAGGEEPETLEPERLRRYLAHDEMAVVHRIEGPAEESDHSLRTPQPCPVDRLHARREPWDETAGYSRRSPARPRGSPACCRPGPA